MLCAIVASALPTIALSQVQPTPPEYYSLDERGVDLISGRFNYAVAEVTIGQPGAGGLQYGRIYLGSGTTWRDMMLGTINQSGTVYTVSTGSTSEVFNLSGSVFTPRSNNGSTLTASSGQFIFTSASGTVATFVGTYAQAAGPYQANAGLLSSVVEPNGERLDYHYVETDYCIDYDFQLEECLLEGEAVRLQSITNNRGYQLHYRYDADDPLENGALIVEWRTVRQVVGLNNAVDYCAPLAFACPTPSRIWPSVTYDGAAAVDELDRATNYVGTSGNLSGVILPGHTSAQFSITYDSLNRVTSFTGATGTWTYTYSRSGNAGTTITDGPSGEQVLVQWDATVGRPSAVQETVAPGQFRLTQYQYDDQRRVERIIAPESNQVVYARDARGNVTSVSLAAKEVQGPPPADIVTSATYPASCTPQTITTCNQPLTTVDPRGYVTDYTYDPVHGGLLTVTEPEPTPGAVRPQMRFAYDAYFARYKDATGVIVQAPSSITLPVSTSTCTTGTSCIGTDQEIRSTVSYASSVDANNLLPTSSTTGAGDASVSATVAMTYDPNGDVITVDGPLVGTGDTTVYLYDAGRRMVGMIGPDPDGNGPLLNRAMRTTYNPDDSVQMSEVGTTTGQSTQAFAAFTSLQQSVVQYDGFVRPTASRFTAAGTTWSLAQMSYDASGRPDCSVQRMNVAAFASPPAACTASPIGPFGPDRIARTTYDLASRPVAVTQAYGTAQAVTELASYTENGLPQTLTDGEGNVSTMEYDGFDRLARMRYPNPTGGGSSTTDYEETTYDASSNVLTTRTRAGQTFSATYDALNRPMVIDAPTGTDDLAYVYDNLGRTLSATIPGSPTQVTAMTWDALGRQTSETGSLGTVAMAHDPAGRLTALTWPDTTTFSYDYDVYSGLTALRQGSTARVTLTHDDLGRRTGIGRANGVVTAMAYDAASRLTGLSHDVAGTAQDVGFAYGYNPAGQILTKTVSNPAFGPLVPAVGGVGYALNGLNQLTLAGGAGITYDADGNLTDGPGQDFTYDARSQLTEADGAELSYDPQGRFDRLDTATANRFLHAGVATIGEYTTAGILNRRHVPGAMIDETLLSQIGSASQFPITDERGSVIGLTDASGAVTTINRYDDYGVPASGNAGLFQYTGQIRLPGTDIHHYKARGYDPGLGRFLQTDPIGYAAGANVYGYVGGDPVNLTDPSGLQQYRRFPSAQACDKAGGTPTNRLHKLNDGTFECDFRTPPPVIFFHYRGSSVSPIAMALNFLARGGEHQYNITVPTNCSPSKAIEIMGTPGLSAPFAPRVRDGTNPNISLFGGNPITQIYTPDQNFIRNQTQKEHWFNFGVVEITAVERGSGSEIQIDGSGLGNWRVLNDIIGYGFFGLTSGITSAACLGR